MKIKRPLITLVLLIGLNFGSFAKAQGSLIGNVTNILNEISTLAAEFNLTTKQKTQIRAVLMDYVPSLALKASAMLNNRQDLFDLTLSQDSVDEDALIEIADRQGKLLTSIIVTKEHLKKDIRDVLTLDQKDFVDELIKAVIQQRLNS